MRRKILVQFCKKFRLLVQISLNSHNVSDEWSPKRTGLQ